ncbi:unnamed protein product [Sphagnum balticum]
MSKIDKVLGEMDIRGKINQIDAQKRFHLIENHKSDIIDDQPQTRPVLTPKQTLNKLFFGLEIAMAGRRGRMNIGGVSPISVDNKYKYDSEFMESECETLECESESLSSSDVLCAMGNWKGQCLWGRPRRTIEKRVVRGGKRYGVEMMASKEAVKNPYLKKQHADEVMLSQW